MMFSSSRPAAVPLSRDSASRARAQGKMLGRPRAAVRSERVLRLRDKGLSIREIAAERGVSAMTVQRILIGGLVT